MSYLRLYDVLDAAAAGSTCYTPRILNVLANKLAAEDLKTIKSEIIYSIISICLTPNVQLIVYELQPLNYILNSLSAVGGIRVFK